MKGQEQLKAEYLEALTQLASARIPAAGYIDRPRFDPVIRMLDRWSGGVENTVNSVEKYGIAHVGAYRSKAEKEGTVICEVGGIKFGFMAYTHTTNSM